MASIPKFSYHRLKNEECSFNEAEEEKAIQFKQTSRKWQRPRFKRFAIRSRPKLRIPGLTRFLRKRRRVLSRLKLSWRKALNRLKHGQAHMNDLFGGNFLVLQVNHTPFTTGKKKPLKGS